jgi:hypothetical protein
VRSGEDGQTRAGLLIEVIVRRTVGVVAGATARLLTVVSGIQAEEDQI